MAKNKVIWEYTVKDAESLLLTKKRDVYRKEIGKLREVCDYCPFDFTTEANIDDCLRCYAQNDAYNQLKREVRKVEEKLDMPFESGLIAFEGNEKNHYTLPFSYNSYSAKYNLNGIFLLVYFNHGESPDSYKFYSNGTNIRVKWVDRYSYTEHDILLRKIKDKYNEVQGLFKNRIKTDYIENSFQPLFKHQDYSIPQYDVEKYTESLLPYVAKKLNWK